MRTFSVADLFLGSRITSDVSRYRCNHCGAPFFVWERREDREQVGLRAINCPTCKNANFELHLWQQGFITVEVKSELARELADWTLIDRDLKAIVEACDRLVIEASREPPDELVCSALWSHAVIKYGRCFGPGDRTFAKMEPLIREELRELHNWFSDLRNKHVAHSFNIFEQAAVGLVLSAPDEDERRIYDVGVLDCAATYPTDDQKIGDLRRLAADLLDAISEKAAELYSAIRAEQESRPIEEFYAPDQKQLYLLVDLSNPGRHRTKK